MENHTIKNQMIRDIRNLFESKKENYYKPVCAGNFYSNNYIKYESVVDKNKTSSIKECLDEIKLCLKDIINDLKSLIHGKFS